MACLCPKPCLSAWHCVQGMYSPWPDGITLPAISSQYQRVYQGLIDAMQRMQANKEQQGFGDTKTFKKAQSVFKVSILHHIAKDKRCRSSALLSSLLS